MFFPASLDFRVWENQDPTFVFYTGLEGKWRSYGHYQRQENGTTVWKHYGDLPPVFRFDKDKDEITGATDLSALEDDTTFHASKKYENQNKGTTTYEMNVRLSTGRYKETWTPDKGEAFESVGNCYKPKEFIGTALVKKRSP